MPEKSDIEQYLKSLSEKEQMAYEIAKSHLGSTFSLEKSNGYLNWSKEPTVPMRPLSNENGGSQGGLPTTATINK
jgi:hypothetical protein